MLNKKNAADLSGFELDKAIAECHGVQVAVGKSVVIEAPQFFRTPEFIAWLNNGQPKMTWHQVGSQPSEWSDVVVLVDPSLSGEGSDSDMPQDIWDKIVAICKDLFQGKIGPMEPHITVRLTNVN